MLENLFGELQGRTYDLQYTLSNGKMADAVLHLPEPMGTMAVDAKFPLENYLRMVDGESDDVAKKEATKEFAKNVKKHIDDIASKYIIPNETADQAILFLPAEAIFSEVHAYHPELVHYAAKKRVWIASPTTLLAMLSTVQSVLLTIERNKHMDEIHQEINKLGEDFSRYEERWEDLSRHLGTVQKDVDKLHISSQKLSDRFKKIARL
jgi:DNA recombination protein RmuC